MIQRRVDELTRREREVLAHVVAGKQNKEVARELNISESTVENHLTNIYRKWEVTSRTEAAFYVFSSEMQI